MELKESQKVTREASCCPPDTELLQKELLFPAARGSPRTRTPEPSLDVSCFKRIKIDPFNNPHGAG